MSGVIRLQRNLRRLLPVVNNRYISTSKKNSDTVDITASATATKAPTSTKNWISYGFENTSEEDDRTSMHLIFFSTVTVCLVFGGFYLAYKPDYSLRDWAQREAFLELRRREQAGLPLIDANFIDPSKIVLPSDEELGDTEIII